VILPPLVFPKLARDINTLAYLLPRSVTKKKSFLTSTPDECSREAPISGQSGTSTAESTNNSPDGPAAGNASKPGPSAESCLHSKTTERSTTQTTNNAAKAANGGAAATAAAAATTQRPGHESHLTHRHAADCSSATSANAVAAAAAATATATTTAAATAVC